MTQFGAIVNAFRLFTNAVIARSTFASLSVNSATNQSGLGERLPRPDSIGARNDTEEFYF